MNLKLRLLISAACFSPVLALADATLYGRANVTWSVENVTGAASALKLDSNASRIGIKGSEKLPPAGRWEMIYQAEYEAAFDDGQTGSNNTGGAFSQRNIFVGAKGPAGQIIAGHFDTPLKTIQRKVDLFDNLKGDISTAITADEKRAANSVMYTTPKFNGFTAHVDVISGEKANFENAYSLAASYEVGTFYTALAYDQNVRSLTASDPSDLNAIALRYVAQYTIADFQLGLLIDHNKTDTRGVSIVDGKDKEGKAITKKVLASELSTTGYMGSIQYNLSKKWAFKAQAGKSDNLASKRDALAYSLGADYIMTKNSKVFAFWSNVEADKLAREWENGLLKFDEQKQINDNYTGIGVEMSF